MIGGIEYCQGVRGKALPAVVADQVGVLQLQIERDVSGQRLCIPCSSAQRRQHVCTIDDMLSLADLVRQSWIMYSQLPASARLYEVDALVKTSIALDVAIASHANAT